MKINCFSVTFWFNILDNSSELLEALQSEVREYQKYEVYNITNNLLSPIISGVNNDLKTNIVLSQINLQYNMNNVSLDDVNMIKEKVLTLFNMLQNNNIKILHTALFINSEMIQDNSLDKIDKLLNKKLKSSELLDVSVKLSKCYEEIFYKIITIFNKKQIKLPRVLDDNGREVPIPLISFNGSFVENELIDISYEINDKYLFDSTKNYSTSDSYLNKMLYVLFDDYESDIDKLLEKGEF
jgi:hypothetical protein